VRDFTSIGCNGRERQKAKEQFVKIGVTFPHFDFGADRDVLRKYVRTVVDCGYDYFLAYDHVLGADTTNRPGWSGYTKDDGFHEIFTLFAYVAALAPELELVSSVVILPQRQTALVAKQAAEIDILTAGNLRLGVGVGWNAVEYEALGEDFHTRGRREEEQIALLRQLWTEPVITFHGEFDTVVEAGLKPLPIQRPIPIWIGGATDVAVRRAARIGDGWFPMGPVDDAQRTRLQLLRETAVNAGRNPDEIGIDARIDTFRVGEASWEHHLAAWQAAGADYISVNSMNLGLDIDGHCALLERFATVAETYR
jgi:probable F420-dependent oxidoreductase